MKKCGPPRSSIDIRQGTIMECYANIKGFCLHSSKDLDLVNNNSPSRHLTSAFSL